MSESDLGTLQYYVNYWVLQSIAMGLTVALLPDLRLTGIGGATLMVAALALVNSFVWDAALFLQVPDSLTSQALVLVGVNGAIFWLLVKLLPSIEIDGIWPAIVAPILFSFFSLVVMKYGTTIDFFGAAREAFDWLQGTRESLLDSTSRELRDPNQRITE